MIRLLLSRLMTLSSAMIGLAVIAGLTAAWAAGQHLRARVEQIESRARVSEVERVVAAYDLPAGIQLDSSHFAVRPFPASLVSSDSLAPDRYSELEGRVLRSPLVAGDTMLQAHVQTRDESAFSTRLAPGRRAITMPVDQINSVSGLLQPGDLIDLYVSFEYQRRRITAPLLQGVLVLATGSSTQYGSPDADMHTGRTDGHFSTVTLDAAPEDAVKLVAARQGGTITAVLRNPSDATPSLKASRGDLATLLGVNRAPPAPPRRKTPVLYGNTVVRSVPRLQSPVPGPRQASGVFDLPYTPRISSAWVRADDSAVSAAEHASLDAARIDFDTLSNEAIQ